MKRVLLTWELGGGLGHIIQIRAFAEQFLAMGNEVYIALMDLSHAANVFAGMNVKLLQAPYKTGYRAKAILPALSFTHILNNNGFAADTELEGLVRSWRNLYELVRPDVICFDHSPSALVAARGYPCVKLSTGVAFNSPPPGKPLGIFTDAPVDKKKLIADDDQVLSNINNVLDTIGQAKLETLDQLFYDGVKTCFQSLPEFDHYQARDDSLYCGPVLTYSGAKPKWPGSYKKRVYVYVKQFQGIVQLFKLFARFQMSFVVYTNNVPDDVLKMCKAPNIRFQSKPLDLSLVSKQADLAIVNAGHSTLCQFVLAGVPVLMVPLQMEQQILAVRMYKQKVGWIADTENPQFMQHVESLLKVLNKGLSVSHDIRDKYAGVDFTERHVKLCKEIIDLA